MKNLFIISLVVGYLSALASTLFYSHLWDNAYYQLNSFAFVMYALAILSNTVKEFKHSKRIKLFVIFIFLNTISNFFDETFYNATQIEINDLIRLITIILITLQCKKHIK